MLRSIFLKTLAVGLVWSLVGIGFYAQRDMPAVLAAGGLPRDECRYEVTVTPTSVSGVLGGTDSLFAEVVSCEGHNNPSNVIMTWTSRNTGVVSAIASTKKRVQISFAGGGSTYVVATSDGGGADSALVSVTADCTPTATHMCPGDNLQAKVDAQATGTAFTLGAGTFQLATIVPKTNQSFTGELYVNGLPVTVFEGGKLLTNWVVSGSYWAVGGQSQDFPDGTNPSCRTGIDTCQFPEELYVSDTLYQRMGTKAEVTAGSQKWFFDQVTDSIVIARNPTGKTILTSATNYAFGGSTSGTGVTVKRILMRHYAAARPLAVVNANKKNGWIVDSNVVRDNGGVAAAVTGTLSLRGRMRWNQLIKAGQMGYWCQGDSTIVYANVFDSNNTAGHGPGGSGEAGAGKCSFTDGLLMRKNISRFNDGPGLWIDIDNINGTVDSNTVEDNDWRGIFWEISGPGIIRHNTVRRNGFDNPAVVLGGCDGAGIFVSNSGNVRVDSNIVENNRNGIMALESDRGPGTVVPYHVTNLVMRDNTVVQTDALRAAGMCDSDPAADAYSVAANNDWDFNTYTLGASTKFRWTGSSDYTWLQWLSFGQDPNGSQSGQ
jgi:parallel beta-helix repeat protein